MDLRSHYPYNLLKSGFIQSYPSLKKNLTTDVAIVGAGITGALVAWHLAKAGIDVVVLDKRHVGMGSTAASTALLQYEIDTPLIELQKRVGVEKANMAYLLCKKAIYDLKDICNKLDVESNFTLNPSFQFASRPSHLRNLEMEYKIRKSIGFKVEFFSAADVHEKFHFRKSGGIFSQDGGQVDAYRLTHGLLREVQTLGGKVFDHSPVISMEHNKKHSVLTVSNKIRVKARKTVIACGYESNQYLKKKIEDLASTYCIITEPLPNAKPWHKNSLIWETAVPYLYMKIVEDNRIIIGGKDVPFYDPVKRDKLIPGKTKQLEKSFNKLFPNINIRTDFQWAGTFSGTKDGLPYIGLSPDQPNLFFALGFGGNGITFSLIAAQILRDKFLGIKTDNDELFSFNR